MPHQNEILLINGNSKNISKYYPEMISQVSVAITSPPYWNAIDYRKHSKSETENWRIRYNEDYRKEYLPSMFEIFNDVYKLLEPGGVLAINSGTILLGGQQIPLPADLSEICVRIGLQPIERITWNKVTGGVKRAGSVIQHRLPGYWHPNIMTEQIHIFKKPGKKHYFSKQNFSNYGYNVWDIAPVPPKTINHPAPFPIEIPKQILDIYAKKGSIVYDPFVGSGSTMIAAAMHGCDAVGVDLDKNFLLEAKERLLNKEQSIRENRLSVDLLTINNWKKNVIWKSRGSTRQGAGKK